MQSTRHISVSDETASLRACPFFGGTLGSSESPLLKSNGTHTVRDFPGSHDELLVSDWDAGS